MCSSIIELQEEFLNILKINREEIYKIDKYYELKTLSFKRDDNYYKNLIWNNEDISAVKLFIEEVTNEDQRDIFNWIKLHTSKLRSGSSYGRNIKIIVRDKYTFKILGIIELVSDFFSSKERDIYIGWDNEHRKKNINNIMNMACCVPCQPFGFNYCGGKLLSQIVFSKEIYDIYYKKYKSPLLGIITTSINGKSIQYDRIKQLKFIGYTSGYTSGYGSTHIPLELYKKAIDILRQNYPKEYKDSDNNSSPKRRKLQLLVSKLGIDSRILFHGEERGIYFGYTSSNSKQFLTGDTDNPTECNDLPYLDTIFDKWMTSRALMRVEHLKKTGRYDHNGNMYYLEDLHPNKKEHIRVNNYISKKKKS